VSTEGQNVNSRSEKIDLLAYSKLALIVVFSTLNYVSVSNLPEKSGPITDFWVILGGNRYYWKFSKNSKKIKIPQSEFIVIFWVMGPF
jgi:hypothetical protein